MKRKFLRTSFIAILLLCSLLFSGCDTEKPPPYGAYISSPEKISFDLATSYSVTVKYGYKECFTDERNIVFLCRGYNAEKTESTEWQVVHEFDSFFAEENLMKLKNTWLKQYRIWSRWEYPGELTVEIPESHLVFENGFVVFKLGAWSTDDKAWIGISSDVWYEYQKTDGEIHFEKVK